MVEPCIIAAGDMSPFTRWLFACVFAVSGATAALASDYEQRRAVDVKKCQGIDPAKYESGLYFNPDGYRSFYVRSQCFQEAAVRFRDDTLCDGVKRRPSLLASSWGYSASRCRTLVTDAIAADRRALEDFKRRYLEAHATFRDFRIERNGNGRDFEFIPVLTGGNAGYGLTIDVVPPGSATPIRIHSSGYFVDARSNLQIYLRREDIQQRVRDFVSGVPYTVRATLTLSLPVGTGDALWSDAFIESVFPERERSQTVSRAIEFPAVLPPRQPRPSMAAQRSLR